MVRTKDVSQDNRGTIPYLRHALINNDRTLYEEYKSIIIIISKELQILDRLKEGKVKPRLRKKENKRIFVQLRAKFNLFYPRSL